MRSGLAPPGWNGSVTAFRKKSHAQAKMAWYNYKKNIRHNEVRLFMINYRYFPQNRKLENHLLQIIEVFKENQDNIDSERHTGSDNIKSDTVLSIVAPGMERIGYQIEKSKKKEDKIRVPVLFGLNGITKLAFEVDGYSPEHQTVIEVEAGRAVTNYQFLKDFYEACMMQDIKYFCIAVKNKYRNSNDFEIVCSFFESLYVSNRIEIPLSGVLVIGY